MSTTTAPPRSSEGTPTSEVQRPQRAVELALRKEDELAHLRSALDLALDQVERAWDEGRAARRNATNPYRRSEEGEEEDGLGDN